MNAAVLVSIHEEYTGKIFAGLKSLEIRKTAPKIKPPFKCYVYETGNGVVGEFTCPDVERISMIGWTNSRKPPVYPIDDEFLNRCCLSYQALESYMQGRVIHAWEIQTPVKYDKPKKVADFMLTVSGKQLERAPQSWCYVEELKEEPLNAL